MAVLAKGLPIFVVPKQIRISAMRYDVVNNRRFYKPSLFLAAHAKRMGFKKQAAYLLPPPSIAAA